SNGGVAQISASGLINDTYHWRARTMDSAGIASAWVSFGSNPDDSVDFTVDGRPNVPTELGQLRADGVTSIAVGGTTPEGRVVFQATVSDPTSDPVKLQIDLWRLAEFAGTFTGYPNPARFLSSSGGVVQISASGLINDTYHWRARTID